MVATLATFPYLKVNGGIDDEESGETIQGLLIFVIRQFVLGRSGKQQSTANRERRLKWKLNN